MFFVLKFSTPQGTPESFNVFPPAPFWLFLGRPLPRSFRLVTIIMDKLKGIPDIWTNGPYVILATRVIEVMRNLGETHFEDVPLALVSRKGETEANSFRVINFLDNVVCLNKEASEYRLNEDGF